MDIPQKQEAAVTLADDGGLVRSGKDYFSLQQSLPQVLPLSLQHSAQDLPLSLQHESQALPAKAAGTKRAMAVRRVRIDFISLDI